MSEHHRLGAARARDPRIDALRALALLGVVVVNLSAYPNTPIYSSAFEVPLNAEWMERALQWVIASLLVAKAYPVLAFLFGYSLVLAARRDAAAGQAARGVRRTRRLAVLGLLHGALLYFGDILLPYAIAAWFTARVMHRRLNSLRRHCLGWLAGAVVTGALMTAPLLMTDDAASGSVALTTTFGTVQSAWAFQALNAKLWMISVLAQLFLLPQVVALMLAGALAARLRLLQHSRWRAGLLLWAGRVLPWAVLANMAVALAAVWPHSAASNLLPSATLSLALSSFIGPLMGLSLMAWWCARQPSQPSAATHRLAALGQRTLSLYLAHSLVAVFVLSGVGLGLGSHGGVEGATVLAIGLWTVGFWLAQIASQRGWRGPAERWLARP